MQVLLKKWQSVAGASLRVLLLIARMGAGGVHHKAVLFAAVQDHFFLLALEDFYLDLDFAEAVVQQHLIKQFDEFAFDRFDLLAVRIHHWRLRSHINSITVYCACNASL
jgi:hypothetical protein